MIDSERLLASFRRLLSISSPSGQEQEVAAYLVEQLRALGIACEVDSAGNVLGRTDGRGEPLLLCAHMDTVEPTDALHVVERDGLICSDGSTILGADDKAGIAVALEAVQSARAHPPLDIVFTVREEVGLLGAAALDLNWLRARRGICLDAGGPIGTLVTSAPSHDRLEAKVIGRAAHAGASPENGINAIAVAAEAITRMRLGRIDPETTANIGIIRGGVATNIVPDLVELVGEARSHNEDTLRAQIQAMRQALESAASEAGARVEINISRNYTRFSIPDDNPLVASMLAVARERGYQAQAIAGGGGSDANVFNAAGMQTFNMSVGMNAAHCKDENIAVKDLVQASEFLTATLERLAG